MRDLYYVALKLFLLQGGKLLVIKDIYGDWDLPGGRIRKDEFKAPFEKIIARKVRDELGPSVRYALLRSVVFMRHERVERAALERGGRLRRTTRREYSLRGKPKVRIFAVGYEARWRGGEIHLGQSHTEFRWVPIRTFRPERYFKGSWLQGVKEYLRLKRKI